MSIVSANRAYYRADHSTRTPCPMCGHSTYGPMDTTSPSGPKSHDKACPIPDFCRCGRKKSRSFALCYQCEKSARLQQQWTAEQHRAVEARERAEGVLSTCAFCFQPGTDDDPLGLWGAFENICAHAICFVDHEYAKVEAQRDSA